MLLVQIKIMSAIKCFNRRSKLKSERVDGSTVPQSYYWVAMGILVWSAQVRDLLGKSSLWVTGKGCVPGTGVVGLGLSVPNTLLG
jgi:hypothetical protein